MDKSLENMITNLEKATGKKLADWVKIVKESGLTKHSEMVNHLKASHGFTHGYANLVVMKAREQESGFSAPADVLLNAQYKEKENLRPVYDKLIAEVSKFGDDVEVAPKKTYVSLRRKKQFALVQPSTKSRLDVGINLKDKGFTGRFEKSGSFNSMCSHRVRIEQINQVDNELIAWIKEAYDQA